MSVVQYNAYLNKKLVSLVEYDMNCELGPPQEASTMRLVTARAAALSPGGADWLSAALALAERYLRQESRRAVRLHTLQQILGFIKRNRSVLFCSQTIYIVTLCILFRAFGDDTLDDTGNKSMSKSKIILSN